MVFRKIGRISRDEQNLTNNDRVISMVYKIRPTPYENHTQFIRGEVAAILHWKKEYGREEYYYTLR